MISITLDLVVDPTTIAARKVWVRRKADDQQRAPGTT
jgi:hypothetical protein